MVIRKLRTLLLIWLALLALLVLFSTLSRSGRDFFFLESSLADGVLPAFQFFNSLEKGVVGIWEHYLWLRKTQEENQKLKAQIEQLKRENLRLRESSAALERLQKILQLKSEQPSIPSLIAEVVGRGPSPFMHTFYINKGRKDGLVRGMPVLIPTGVAGRVERTSRRYALVTLLYDPSFAVDCLSQRSRVRGVLTGIGEESRCQMKYVGRTEDIRPGDVIVTSGLDMLFPKGLLLGRVSRVDPLTKGNFLFVEVVPEVHLGQVEEVLVLLKKPPIPDREPLLHD